MGHWLVAAFASYGLAVIVVAIYCEGCGIPLPGETVLLAGGQETVSGTDEAARISGGTQVVFGLTSGATLFSGSQVVGVGGTATDSPAC